MKRIRPLTWAWLAAAGCLAVWTHADRDVSQSGPGFVSTRSSARKVFPALMDATLKSATIELAPSGGDPIELRPSADGHALWLDGQLVGPADPRAVEGLWASLRLATTLRAVSEGADLGREGTITITIGEERRALTLGMRTADEVGRFAIIDNPNFDPEHAGAQTWVVEEEMAEILAQDPQAWVARRAVVVEPGQILSIDLQGAKTSANVSRGEDGRFRSQVQTSVGVVTALLSTDAVEARLARLVGARLAPLLPEGARSEAEPWARLEATGGRSWDLSIAGTCPGEPLRTVLVRGGGWPGCIDTSVAESWPLPGRGGPRDGALLEPRLSPYGYGRILRVEQRLPTRHALSRKAGDWTLSTEEGVLDLDGPDVYAWYETLQQAEVALLGDARTDPSPKPGADPPSLEGVAAPQWFVDVELTTDSTQRLRLRCTAPGAERICQRDEGPLLRLRSPTTVLATSAKTFADRDLLRMVSDDVRSVEITGPGLVRQSVHFDLGVWRLDAPQHPEGDAALSDVILEEVLAATSAVRVVDWTARPEQPPVRTLRLEQTPQAGRDTTVVLELWPDPLDAGRCVGAVGERVGRLRESTCARLFRDLLHTDPVQFWIDTARTIEVAIDDHSTTFRRTPEGLIGEGAFAEDDFGRLRALADHRVVGLVKPSPEASQGALSLRVTPRRGEPIRASIDAAHVILLDQGWAYRVAPPS